MQASAPPVIFAQHGWADTPDNIGRLARELATPDMQVIAPDLGYIRTWLRMEPLIDHVEQIARDTLAAYPNAQLRILGHSMGGLIWTEVLHRHPEWWQRVEWFTLIASPIGGAHLGRLIDPLGIGIGIAADLGKSRRCLAQQLAAHIPMLVLAGVTDGFSDDVVTVGATRIPGTQMLVLPGFSHAELRYHPLLVAILRHYSDSGSPCAPPDSEFDEQLVNAILAVRGMTDAHHPPLRFEGVLRATTGTTISTGRNLAGVQHVYVSLASGTVLYGGYVGWMHEIGLSQTIKQLQRDYASRLWQAPR